MLYLSIVLAELGFTLELRGELDAARALHTEAFRISQDYESRRGMCWALEGLAATLLHEPAIAARLLGAAGTTRDADGSVVTAAEAIDIERIASSARTALGEAYDTHYNSGLTMQQAFALVAAQE